MSASIWKPHATVAAVVEHAGRFLLVEEETAEGRRFNQPAGHMDHGESLLAACVREAREETGFDVVPTALVGIYQWSPLPGGETTYLRFAYAAQLSPGTAPERVCDVVNRTCLAERRVGEVEAALDEGIVRAVWLDYAQILACRERHRSPLVLQCIDDFRAGRRFPLELIAHHD
ncbi:NUDIX hydrolase [Chitinimonas arctica]|uniref:Phosphatase NudJ n=1 Tax=Chitinimonas arctica TaxID=2594795 RepID=A0A516SDU4_9NEIS|nr:NUDIX hydrolase [Chitinimonas arctica]QDQ26325.1 NUDIX hydrolase [Chitinimonas arctica]